MHQIIISWFVVFSLLIPSMGLAKSVAQPDPVLQELAGTSWYSQIVPVRAIIFCDDDGSNCAGPITKKQLLKATQEYNKVVLRSDLLNPNDPIAVKFVPAKLDPIVYIDNSVANIRCTLVQDPAKGAPEDLNGDGEVDEDEICDKTYNHAVRQEIGLDHLGVLPLMMMKFRPIPEKDEKGNWSLSEQDGGSSSCSALYINMPGVKASSSGSSFGNLLSHEGGHYFCNSHPFSRDAKDLTTAAKQIKKYLKQHPGVDPKDHKKIISDLYDYDLNAIVEEIDPSIISDTPPDPKGGIFEIIYGDKCDPQTPCVSVPVWITKKQKEVYQICPDRGNIMSYFKGCELSLKKKGIPVPEDMRPHYSADQAARFNSALYEGKALHLVDGEVGACYLDRMRGLPQLEHGDLIDWKLEQYSECVTEVAGSDVDLYQVLSDQWGRKSCEDDPIPIMVFQMLQP